MNELPITEADMAPCLIEHGFLAVREGLRSLGLWGDSETVTLFERAEAAVCGLLPETDDASGPF